MSRVEEERETQRIEARRQEEAQRAKTRQASQDFQKLVTKKQTTAAKVTQKAYSQQQKQQTMKQTSANTALLARNGIQTQTFASQLVRQSDGTREQQKLNRDVRKSDMDRTQHTEEKYQKGETAKAHAQGDRLAAISRDDARKNHGGSDGEHSDQEQKQLANMVAENRSSTVGQAAPTQGATGAAATGIPQHILQALVDKVYVGLTAQGLSQMVIQFNSDVLAGSQLKLTAQNGKISMQFQTDDRNVGRLIKSSQRELHQAFAQKGLVLERLEVQSP